MMLLTKCAGGATKGGENHEAAMLRRLHNDTSSMRFRKAGFFTSIPRETNLPGP
jgi:hypothetical protein